MRLVATLLNRQVLQVKQSSGLLKELPIIVQLSVMSKLLGSGIWSICLGGSGSGSLEFLVKLSARAASA